MAEEYFIYTNKKGQSFYLHERKTKQTLIGRSYHIYYFNHELRQDEENNSLKEVPKGYIVAETERTGYPFLKSDFAKT